MWVEELYFPSRMAEKILLQEIDLIEAVLRLCKSVWFMPQFLGIYKWVQNVVWAPENKPASYLLPP